MIAPYLEIAVLVLGMTILMCETFAANIDKKIFAYAGIVGLVAVLIASFFLTDSPTQHAGPFWNFYSADALSIFFKRFSLVTTIVVLVMMIDYAPVVRSAAGHASNLGEFFFLPVLTCAGFSLVANTSQVRLASAGLSSTNKILGAEFIVFLLIRSIGTCSRKREAKV